MEESISLKELILIILEEWRIIIGTTVIALFFSFVVVIIFNETNYTTTVEGNITKIDQYDTSYGLYNTNIAKVDEQINLVNDHEYSEYLKSSDSKKYTLTPKIINGTNFQFNIQSSDETVLTNIANDIIGTFQEYLNYNLQSKAISYFLVLNEINVKKLDELKLTDQSLLNVLKEKVEGVQATLQSNIINPAYQILVEEITRLELNELSKLVEKSRLENAIEVLNSQRSDSFTEYLSSSNRFEQVSVSMTISDNIVITSTKQFEPLLTISIAVVLGIMIGVFIAFFKNYWQNS